MKRNSLCQAKRLWDSFCGWMAQVLSIKFLSLKMSGWRLVVALRRCVEWRVTAGRLSIKRRILVIISPATLARLVGHLRGEENRKLGRAEDRSTAGWPEGRSAGASASQQVPVSKKSIPLLQRKTARATRGATRAVFDLLHSLDFSGGTLVPGDLVA